MVDLNAILKPEIQAGSLVMIDLDRPKADTHVRELLRGWDGSYQWPMKVRVRFPEHVVLEDKNGKTVHLGGAEPFFHVVHVRLA